jgi:hypothetical protein
VEDREYELGFYFASLAVRFRKPGPLNLQGDSELLESKAVWTSEPSGHDWDIQSNHLDCAPDSAVKFVACLNRDVVEPDTKPSSYELIMKAVDKFPSVLMSVA